MKPGSQKPPKQRPEQHCALLVQAPLICVQLVGGVPQTPAVQLLEQQVALPVQAPPAGVHGVLHACVAGSQMPWQQSPSTVHAAPCARHTPAAKPQRGGSTVWSQFIEQQPEPGPELQVSPVGRQSVFVASI